MFDALESAVVGTLVVTRKTFRKRNVSGSASSPVAEYERPIECIDGVAPRHAGFMTLAERVARAYIAASNRNDQASMVENFHPDAQWIPIAPIEPLRGLEVIREHYLNEVRTLNAPIVEDVYVANEHRCVVEFVVDHPEHGRVPIVDVFDVDDDGRITRLAVYRH